MAKVYILLGTSEGNKYSNIQKAIIKISEKIGNITRLSQIYESEAWGFTSVNSFYNQVIELETVIEPEILLNNLLEIEAEMGRIRNNSLQYSSRIIDLDILFYDNIIVNSKSLTIPHPQLHKRKFTLLPLVDLISGYVHPILKKTVCELSEICDDNLLVTQLKN